MLPMQPRFITSRVPTDEVEREGLFSEIRDLLRSGAVEQCSRRDVATTSPVFVVPKQAPGSFRFIMDLREVNKSWTPPKTRLITFATIAACVRPGTWLAVADVRSAFHQVPVAASLRRWFGFRLQGRYYRFRSCPFGWNVSPWAWNQFFKPVLSRARDLNRGVSLLCYVDDILFVGDSEDAVSLALARTRALLEGLGFALKLDERAAPSQRTRFLGFNLDATTASIACVPARTAAIARTALALHHAGSASLLQTARLLGSLRSLRAAYRWVLLDSAHLSRFVGALDWSDRHRVVTLPRTVLDELPCLARSLRSLHAVPLSPPPPDLVLTTDASGYGWGGFLSTGERASGVFTLEEAALPAVAREALAVVFALRSLRPCAESLLIRSDSTVVVVSLITRRARGATLISPMREIRDLLGHTHVTSTHIPGIRNTLADALSRSPCRPHAHIISRRAFASAVRQLGLSPDVDLFADRLTAKVVRYYSARADPYAVATNAFTADWSEFSVAYANPPFSLIARTLAHWQACTHRSRDESPKLILVVPSWPTADWARALSRLSESTAALGTACLSTGIPALWPLEAHLLRSDR